MLSVRVPPAELNISAFPPVLGDWVINGLGMPSLVYATGHIKDPVPLIAKRRGLSPGGRFPPSFIHQVIIITGLNKLYNCKTPTQTQKNLYLRLDLTKDFQLNCSFTSVLIFTLQLTQPMLIRLSGCEELCKLSMVGLCVSVHSNKLRPLGVQFTVVPVTSASP